LKENQRAGDEIYTGSRQGLEGDRKPTPPRMREKTSKREIRKYFDWQYKAVVESWLILFTGLT